MFRYAKACLTATLVLASSMYVGADDLALLTIIDEGQVSQAEVILGEAYGKIGDRFLVAVDTDKQNKLAAAGIDIEVVLSDADPLSTQLVLQPCSQTEVAGINVGDLGRTVYLGDGVQLAQLSRMAASVLSSTSEYKLIPLEDHTVGFHYLPPVTPAPSFELLDFPSDSLVDLVSQDSIYSFNKRLEDFYTRYIWTDSIDRARDWMVQKFHDWGYTDVTTPAFSWGGGTHYNVKAVKPGYAEPDKIIVVGGHYDAITLGQPLPPSIFAPGADDDGSGTTVTLELARVLANVPLRKTVIFMPFSAEEVGLVGSADAAGDFRDEGADLEVMFNYDMVGYTGGAPFNIDLQSGSMDLYLQLTMAAAQRLTSLTPIHTALSGSSDHASFHNRGFYIVNTIESNFNFPGWHTQLDLTSQMNFPYLTEVVKMALASVAITAESPSPATVQNIVDVGDGQSLEIHWSDCHMDNSHVIYRGDSPGLYVDSANVGSGRCSFVWDGLVEGEQQYFLVISVAPNGYRAIYGVEGSEEPLIYPRPPKEPELLIDSALITLQWTENTEADLAYYNVYRRVAELGQWHLHQTNLTTPTLVDTSVVGGIPYGYHVTSVDMDGYESEPSEIVVAYAATFDGGPAIVDAFSEDSQYMPTQAEQEVFFDSLMSGNPYGLVQVEGVDDFLSRSDAGRFSSLIWIDDDLTRKTIDNSEDAISWYTGYNVNMMISGYYTIIDWSPSTVPANHLLYEDFMVSGYSYWGTPDFVGAFGQNGWPSVAIDPSRGMDEWPNIPALEPRSGATVIYTYDSFIDWPDFEGKPVGLAYEGPKGKRVILSFPIYNLTPATSQALMVKLLDYFDDIVIPVTNGDLNGDGIVDIADITVLIDYLFISLQPPADLNTADVDASCFVDLGDLTLMIGYLFLDGPEPQAGCVE